MKYQPITLKKGKDSSLRRFHPWVFSGAIQKKSPDLKEGEVVEVYDNDGQYLGTGHFQIGSIMVRVFSFKKREIDREFWKEKLGHAISLRRSLGLIGNAQTNMFRLIHGEGDGFPGLIVDVYGSLAVVQCHSVGFYHIRTLLAELIQEELPEIIEAVYDKSAQAVPFKAELGAEDGYLFGQSQAWKGKEYGLSYEVDAEGGQKTGFFVDQRENRRLLGEYSQGKDVLNTFCYTGGFSVASLAGGAQSVDSIDSSAKAIELTDKNVALNFGEESRHQSFTQDAFEFLKDIHHKYDLIVLDPPAFAKHHKVLDRALKGYRKINRLAFEQIRPNGILFTFSCSQVVSADHFRKAVFTAASQSHRRVQILHQLHQPPDHPVNIYHPEGEYLKGLVLQVE
ncbi:MAG: class I SAM-dependent rRNA methyltransferase [Bacteroidia bacterium]|nr:class I SAM-dependent rRNA methyltransferase [Bacteroidia bacterium]